MKFGTWPCQEHKIKRWRTFVLRTREKRQVRFSNRKLKVLFGFGCVNCNISRYEVVSLLIFCLDFAINLLFADSFAT
jgi:hypothetical protein